MTSLSFYLFLNVRLTLNIFVWINVKRLQKKAVQTKVSTTRIPYQPINFDTCFLKLEILKSFKREKLLKAQNFPRIFKFPGFHEQCAELHLASPVASRAEKLRREKNNGKDRKTSFVKEKQKWKNTFHHGIASLVCGWLISVVTFTRGRSDRLEINFYFLSDLRGENIPQILFYCA